MFRWQAFAGRIWRGVSYSSVALVECRYMDLASQRMRTPGKGGRDGARRGREPRDSLLLRRAKGSP